MTPEKSYWSLRDKSIGDLAVDGLLAGLLAGLIMGVFLVLADWMAGIGPIETLSRFDPGVNASPLVGGLFHLALSGLYGAVFALGSQLLIRVRPAFAQWLWLIGAVYGLLLWFAAQAVLVTGFNEALGAVPAILFALAHVVYGVVLGLSLARVEHI